MFPLIQELLSVVNNQGSILGPLLFILYVNDIMNVFQFVNLILFADDTNMFISDNDLTSLIVKAMMNYLNYLYGFELIVYH